MNDYVFIKDQVEDPETTYILKTTFPAKLGKVIQFPSQSDRDDFIAAKKAQIGQFEGAVIYGYNMAVVQSGEIPIDMSRNNTPGDLYETMAAFMLSERILLKPNAYKRLKNDET